MLNSILFMIVNLAVFWVMAWALKQDKMQTPEEVDDNGAVN